MKLSRDQANALAKKLGIVDPVTNRKTPRKDRKNVSYIGDQMFDALCTANGLPVPDHEYEWGKEFGRKWRADWCFAGVVLVEQVGGVWIRGHHSRGQTQVDDMERRNMAQIAGYLVLEFTPEQIASGEAFPVIRRALGSEYLQS